MGKNTLPLLVAVLAFSLKLPRTTTVNEACNNTHQVCTAYDNTTVDAWILFRNRGRGRSPLNKGGRGLSRGECNAFDPTAAQAATREGSPINSLLLTSLYCNSTADETLALFL